MGSTLPGQFEQEIGDPQGSTLSPALFNIRINNTVKSVLRETDTSLFVDDFALCIRGSTFARVERAMQLSVNSVQKRIME